MTIRDDAEALLGRLTGSPSPAFRDGQWEAIEQLVERRGRVLVVQRTGWGKSAVYFIATRLLRDAGAGATVLISPLLALMRNQLQMAERAGVRAATINSDNRDQWAEIEAQIRAGEIDLLLISPERLNNTTFRANVLPQLLGETGLLVVDEAHCISDWGHDFRPDYRRLRTLLAELPVGTPVLATTATANARVVADVAEQLSAGADGADGGPLVLRGALDRESLHLSVVRLPSPAHRLAWLADNLPQLPGSGIVYTLTVAAAEEVAAFLRARGLTAAAYSGRTDDAERRQAEDDLLANRLEVLVATSALGMGFDKPDLGFVVHLGAPASPVAYYQQVGRAGRGVERAEVVLLPGAEDEAIWRYFGSLGFPPEDQVRQVLAALSSDRPTSTPALEARVDLRRSRLEMMLKVLDVDGAVRRVRGGWLATGEPWVYDSERYARVAAGRTAEQQAMRDYATAQTCRMEFLRKQLDDIEAAPCGRCDTCTGRPRSTDVDRATLAAAQAMLGKPGVEVEPRRLWPTGMSEVKGKIPASLQAETGRALGRLSDIGWGGRLREIFAGPDGEIGDDVVRAVIQVLAGWDWAQRPAGIVLVPSRSRPRLIRSLATRLAELGRLPIFGELERLRETPASTGRSNSAQRLRAVHGAFAVPSDMILAGEPVLLIDDRTDTRWTLTECTRVLRDAGAGQVLPLVLALDA